MSWTRSQQAAVLAACLAGWIALLIAARTPAQPLHDVEGTAGNRAAAALERIDPNTASLGSLMRLPGIGRARGQAILADRERPGAAPYRAAEDLERVKGIGPVGVARMAPYLALPGGGGEAPPAP